MDKMLKTDLKCHIACFREPFKELILIMAYKVSQDQNPLSEIEK